MARFFKIKKMKLNYVKNLKKGNFKICYVSHELQQRKITQKKIKFLSKINKEKLNLEMIIIKKKY